MGPLIVIEGVDGAGKTTQAKRLCNRLEKEGRSVVYTREPGGTFVGEKIREILLNKDIALTPMAALLLFSAARSVGAYDVTRPARQRGDVVVMDRYYPSSIVYQTLFSEGLISMQDVERVVLFSLRGCAEAIPSVVVILQVRAGIAIARTNAANRTQERYKNNPDMVERVAGAYTYLSPIFGEPVVYVDGTGTDDEVHARIMEAVAPFLK